MDRRRFIQGLGLGLLWAGFGAAALWSGAALAEEGRPPTVDRLRVRPRVVPKTLPPPTEVPPYFPAPVLERIPIPGGAITRLPGDGNLIALTVDDGASSEVVAAYAELSKRTGLRITFFVTATYRSWDEQAPLIRPLVESGQVQLANHTWNHPDLTTVDAGAVRRELERCGDYLRDVYGVEAAPYFRPPYGRYDDAVLASAASVGYRQTVMWHGTIGDSGPIGDAEMSALIQQWFTAQRIVIAHANVPTVLGHFEEIVDVIRDRGLRPVTLDDVYLRP